MTHAAKNYTSEQKEYNKRLTEQLISYAKECGYGPLFERASPPALTPSTDDHGRDGGGVGRGKKKKQRKAGKTDLVNNVGINSSTGPVSDFGSFAVVRDRIRCYYKSFVQSSKRRALRRKLRFGMEQGVTSS